jgi:hypothetical protein
MTINVACVLSVLPPPYHHVIRPLPSHTHSQLTFMDIIIALTLASLHTSHFTLHTHSLTHSLIHPFTNNCILRECKLISTDRAKGKERVQALSSICVSSVIQRHPIIHILHYPHLCQHLQRHPISHILQY